MVHSLIFLFYMKQFANEITRDEIIQQPAGQIPWGTIITIMSKSKSHEEMLWYINATHKNGWSRSMVLNEIANDLKEYGNSYSFRNLKYMSQFSKEFINDEIRQHPVAQIPWWTLVTIISKSKSYEEISSQLVSQIPWGTLTTVIMSNSKSHEEMLWYINATHKNGWSRSMILNEIANDREELLMHIKKHN